MQLGFVTAILPELSLEEVMAFAADEGFSCIEPMCWPVGGAERRYAGVTHIDVATLNADGVGKMHDLVKKHNVTLSGLGYYPNPLSPDTTHKEVTVAHIRKLIDAAKMLGLGVVNTFIGRDHTKSLEAQWPDFDATWLPLAQHVQAAGIKIAIEHCPMLFSNDEWPGGKNMATSPVVWRQMFERLPGNTIGLNFDPSHLIWQMIDIPRAIREFAPRIYHVHAKDERVDHDRLYERGVLGLGWHIPKLPGLGDVAWGPFFAALGEIGYSGPVCIEVEDRAFEGSLADRKRALRQSKRFLEQFCS